MHVKLFSLDLNWKEKVKNIQMQKQWDLRTQPEENIQENSVLGLQASILELERFKINTYLGHRKESRKIFTYNNTKPRKVCN